MIETITRSGIVLLCFILNGCNVIGLAVNQVFGGDSYEIREARSRDLENQTVAVMVDADYTTVSTTVKRQMIQTIANELVDSVKGIKLIPTDRVIGYQQKHRYWRQGDLDTAFKELHADRLLIYDLNEYALEQSQGFSVLIGKMRGNLSIEKMGQGGISVMSVQMDVNYSPNGRHGSVVTEGAAEIRDQLVERLSVKIVNLFRDLTVKVK